MTEVVMELNESLATEMARMKERSKDDILLINLNLGTELSPHVR